MTSSTLTLKVTDGLRCPGKERRLVAEISLGVVVWEGTILNVFEEEGEKEGAEEEVERRREVEDVEEVLCLCPREVSEREEAEEEVERCLEEEEYVRCLCAREASEREEVEGCRDEEEDVRDLGTFSTCAAATEPPIWGQTNFLLNLCLILKYCLTPKIGFH